MVYKDIDEMNRMEMYDAIKASPSWELNNWLSLYKLTRETYNMGSPNKDIYAEYAKWELSTRKFKKTMKTIVEDDNNGCGGRAPMDNSTPRTNWV